MADPRMQVVELLRKALDEGSGDLCRDLLATMVSALMGAEADNRCGADYGSRAPERVNARNGYRERRWDTRVGTIELAIPKLRRGSYFPDWLLEPRRRAEKALSQVIAESYVLGVSTRRVDRLVQSLGIEGISKSQVSEIARELDEGVAAFRSRPLVGAYAFLWLDALEIKSREEGRVVNVSTLVAHGVNADGHREVLGIEVVTSEDGAGWLAFLRSLVSRGLSGVRLVVSDAHPGLKQAIAATLPGAAWQRCRTHFLTNLLAKVPRSAQQLVATLVRSIFAQPDASSVRQQYDRVVEQLDRRFEAAAHLLADAREELLAFAVFPKAVWRQIWSNNPLERLNKEIRRRTDVVGIFPNREAIYRLVGAVLAEQTDEWALARRYISLECLAAPPNLEQPVVDSENDLLLATA